MRTIPLINIAALRSDNTVERWAVVQSIAAAFRDIGFMAVQGHNIPEQVISAMREQTRLVFKRPIDEKLALPVQPTNYRGYIPLGFFTPNGGGGAANKHADQYEAYKLHYEMAADDPICGQCDLYGPNRWPENSFALEAAVTNYWRHCDRVTDELLLAIATFFDSDPAYFKQALTMPLTNMTLLHYPPCNRGADHFGIHPHKDTDLLTVLAADLIGGLYLRPRQAKQWIEAKVPSDALIINVGDMLEIWSGGYFMSTPHKVVNESDQHRYSFPYFSVPRFDITISPRSDSMNFDRAAMRAGEVSKKIWRSNWPNADSVEEEIDPYTH